MLKFFKAEFKKPEGVEPVLSRGVYDVFVGAIEEDKLPMYVVINRDTGVVEFTHEVIAFINDWLTHFVKDVEAANQVLGQLDLGLVSKN